MGQDWDGNFAGNYWAIHPACVDSFERGDYRRRHARRRALAISKTSIHHRAHPAASASPPPAAEASADTIPGCALADTGSTDSPADYTSMDQVRPEMDMGWVNFWHLSWVGQLGLGSVTL